MGKYYYLSFCKSKRDHSKWMQFKKIDIKSKCFEFPEGMFSKPIVTSARTCIGNPDAPRINFAGTFHYLLITIKGKMPTVAWFKVTGRILILFPSVSSFLYIASAADPLIRRYNPRDGTSLSFTYAGAAQSISFDQFDNVVYWVNFIENSHRVMKTTLTGTTIDLNITYSGEIEVTSDMLNFYVLDKDNDRIDKYLKTSLEKLGNITHAFNIMELIVGYGESKFLSIS